jgi:hypothetical protein
MPECPNARMIRMPRPDSPDHSAVLAGTVCLTYRALQLSQAYLAYRAYLDREDKCVSSRAVDLAQRARLEYIQSCPR